MSADSIPPARATPAAPATDAAAKIAADNARGILAMVAGMASFVTSDTMLKLAGRELPVGELIFFRGWLSSVMVILLGLALGAFVGARRHLAGRVGPLIAWRTLGEIGATICFLSGLVRLPFADAAAIGQFVPLAVTAGAALFLAEPVGWRRWLATLVGFIGVLVIIKPGTAVFDWNALWILASVVFVTTRDLVTRVIGPGPPALLMIAISAVGMTLVSPLFLLVETWVWPSPTAFAYLVGAAIGSVGGYIGVVAAMRTGEISVVSPFRYAVILFALFYSMTIFGEMPALSTLFGIVIVLAAGLYMFHRERVRRAESR